jgi:hypothetical protein
MSQVTSIVAELISGLDVKLQPTEVNNAPLLLNVSFNITYKFQDPIPKRAMVAHKSDIRMIVIMII